jgi:hypothetical protein
MRCSSLAAQFALRHDILKGILRRAVPWSGIASTLLLPLCRLPASLPPLAALPTALPFALRSGQYPHGPATGHLHHRLFFYPPSLHGFPLRAGYHSWSGGIPSGPAEEDCACPSGAAWLRLRTLLCGDILSPRPKYGNTGLHATT